MEFKVEVVMLPVSDVDASVAFYRDKCGFTLDVDHKAGDAFRVVQFTPEGSACSIVFGVGLLDGEPGGTVKGTHLLVTDVQAAYDYLKGRGVEMDDLRHMKDGEWKPGVDPDHNTYASFSGFSDPDGNTFILQERP